MVIRKISDATHPANGQRGLFARSKIKPNSLIIDYLGEVHTDEPDSNYDLSLSRQQINENVYLNIGVGTLLSLI